MVFELGRPGKVQNHYISGKINFPSHIAGDRAKPKESIILINHQGALRELQ